MRCRICGREAVYKELRFCPQHFQAFYLKKIRSYLASLRIRNLKVLLAVSGGKDSVALAHGLSQVKSEFGLKLAVLFIDLGIPGYSEECQKYARGIAENLDLPFCLVRLSDYGKTIAEIRHERICGICGTAKRYLMNRFAWENGFDYIATGHNLDDELAFILNGLLSQDLQMVLGAEKFSPTRKEKKLIGKLKPLYYLTEDENRLYCEINGLDYCRAKCPFSRSARQLEIKERMKSLFKSKQEKINFVKTIRKIKKPQEEQQVRLCEKCGFPSFQPVCKFCSLIAEK